VNKKKRLVNKKKNIREQEKKINDLQVKVDKFDISEGHLLLGSLATQIIVKMCRFLDNTETLDVSVFRSMGSLNESHNIASLKTFLYENGHSWDDIRLAVNMFKMERRPTAHPGSHYTTTTDIELAIENCYPGVSSPLNRRARRALRVLELLANRLNEPLFVSILLQNT